MLANNASGTILIRENALLPAGLAAEPRRKIKDHHRAIGIVKSLL